MIAADSSAWLDFAKGVESAGAKHLEAALVDGSLVLPLPVLFELLSGPGLPRIAEKALLDLPRLEISLGYWERAGHLRRNLLKRGLRARAMDCLIAQSCIDHRVSLIAQDRDFRHFGRFGLNLI